MFENVQHCPLCGSPRSSLFDRRDFRGQPVSNRLCRACGLVYQSPRMSEAEMATFYAQEYRQVYQGSPAPTQKDLSAQAGRAGSLLNLVEARLENVSRHLDIGCSAGILLQQFQTRYNCQSAGVEPGEAYRMVAQSQGSSVYPSLEALSAAGELPFDFISLAHVLEHIPQPVGYLACLREQFLTPTGSLLLEVPNIYAHDCFEIAHLVSFSEHTLRQTLKQAGFAIVVLQKHGRPRSSLLSLYLTVLARPTPHSPQHWEGRVEGDGVRPERGVRLKRRIGMLRRNLLSRLFPRRAWIAV